MSTVKVLACAIAMTLVPHALTHAAETEPSSRAYEKACGLCHSSTSNGYGAQSVGRRRGADKALLHERDDLNAEFIRIVVRNGYLAMPPITRVELSDAELEELVRYLTRNNAEADSE